MLAGESRSQPYGPRTEADGSFEFRGLRAGDYELIFFISSSYRIRRSVMLGENEVRTLDLTLGRG